MINLVRQQVIKVKLTFIYIESHHGGERRPPMLVLDCEKGGVYKRTKKKSNQEDMRSRKCERLFRLCG